MLADFVPLVLPVFMELRGAQPVQEQRNVLMLEDTDFSKCRLVDLEHDLWRVFVWRELDHSCHAARIFPTGRRVHFLADQFVAEFLNELICLHGSCRQVEFPPAKLTEPINQLRGILAGEISGLIGELGEAALQPGPGDCGIPVLLGCFGQQLLFYAFQLRFHNPVVGEVHGFELVDKADQTIEGFASCKRTVGIFESFSGDNPGLSTAR
jgi:hypothetical protein